jgi:hypothetical protein
MPRKLSPAQRANQITYFLKGDLKRIQIAYIRAGAKLAQIRDEKLYRALKHATLEAYAQKRLGLGRSTLYRYLQIYDWVRKDHPGWLAERPKGFIPELTDAYGLMWIEKRLEDEHLGPETRKGSKRCARGRSRESSRRRTSRSSGSAANSGGTRSRQWPPRCARFASGPPRWPTSRRIYFAI